MVMIMVALVVKMMVNDVGLKVEKLKKEDGLAGRKEDGWDFYGS